MTSSAINHVSHVKTPPAERILRAIGFILAGVVIAILIIVSAEGWNTAYALMPIIAGTYAAMRDYKNPTARGTKPSIERLKKALASGLSGEARCLYFSTLTLLYLYFESPLFGHASNWDDFIFLTVATGAILLWEIAIPVILITLAVIAIRHWHLGTAASVLAGSIIIALAIRSRR